uniref:Putative group viii salivary lipocalin n=1 Tax=Rhipicephalus pulchellus TaxID=72859 RepID=L7M8S4_RHIPC
MMFLLCSVWVFYVFLFAATYADEIKLMTAGISNMPGNSSADVALVGYSLEFERTTMSCFISKYESRDDEWVYRKLEFKEKSDDYDQEVTIRFKLKVCEGTDFLEVGESLPLRGYIGGSTIYQILYCDNTSLVMSNFKNDSSGYCSFWVTMDRVKNIPVEANEAFHQRCKQPKFVGYDQETCKYRIPRS